ncbi:MAG TPA: DUF1080 domain-containing protein [Opitutaceae bacterium]|nr:DUF1080 domain-containing protein [Opitutaceae bacterium]
MSLARRLVAPLVLAGLMTGVFAGQPASMPPANAIVLLTGRNLNGWRLYLAEGKKDPSAATVTPLGTVSLDSKLSGYLVTEHTFGNYRLHVEWRWPKDAPPTSNSGVLLHVHGGDAIWPACFEAQLKNGNAGQVVGMGVDIPAAPMVSNRKRSPRLADPSEKPPGEWNACDITCRENTIEVFVNGVRQNYVEKLPVASGHIALQLEGYPIEFTNVWIAPLPKD